MRKYAFAFLVTYVITFGVILTSCSDNDDTSSELQPSELAKAIVGEWIVEIPVDEVALNDTEKEAEATANGHTIVLIYHFDADGTCWKEINEVSGGTMVFQPVSRYDYDCKYTIEAGGKVVVEYPEGEESDELYFNGKVLTDDYYGTDYPLARATDAQSTFYKQESDAWHGGSDETKYDVADYKPKGVNNSQWMKQLKDNRLVADLSLPGTHDACTAEGWHNEILAFVFEMSAKCQDLTISEQLKIGVRVFDLRPEHDLDGKDYVLRCSHGIAATKMYVSDFFKTLKEFLASNPTEFCVLTVDLSNTRDKKKWGKDFYALVTSDEYKSMFADFKPRLTVGEMRGKVLMLSKEVYADKPVGGYCYGWVYDLELEKQQQGHITAADGSETPLWVQDYWGKANRNGKDDAVVRMLEAAAGRDMSADKPAWVINYPSAYFGGPFSDSYRENAVFANKVTSDWLDAHKGSVGVIYMDFAGMENSPDYTKTKLHATYGMTLVDRVIKQNWK